MRCVACAVGRGVHTIGVESRAGVSDDENAYEPAVHRRGHGGPNDMPSRADRNRLRRLAHAHLFAWLICRRPG